MGVPPKWVNQIKPVEHEDEVDDSESYNENKDESRVGKDEEEMNPYERLREVIHKKKIRKYVFRLNFFRPPPPP